MIRYGCACTLALTLVAALPAPAAGMRTHAEMSERMVARFLDHPEAMLPGLHALFAPAARRGTFYSGSMWPDTGYEGLYPHAAETAHWRPFQDTYADLLRASLVWPLNAADQRRLVFFLGAVAHGVQDVPWHFSIGGHKSLTQMVEENDPGNPSLFEPLGDIYLHNSEALEPPLPAAFDWDLETAGAALAQHGVAVAPELLAQGAQRHERLWTAAAYAGFVPALAMGDPFPWLRENQVRYYYGGVDHAAALTAMWTRYFYARTGGWHYYQQMPEYGRSGAGYVPYRGVQDTTLLQAQPTHDAGGEPWLTLGNPAAAERRLLVRFDLRDVPPDTAVARATLWLRFAGWEGVPAVPARATAYAAPTPWTAGPGQSDAVDGTGGVPASAEGAATWARAGATLEEAAVIAQEPLPGTDAAIWWAMDVTSAARAWVADPAANRGLVMTADTGGAIARFYASEAFKQQADGLGGGIRVAWRPILIVQPDGAPLAAHDTPRAPAL